MYISVIPRQVIVNLSTMLANYTTKSSFSNSIDFETIERSSTIRNAFLIRLTLLSYSCIGIKIHFNILQYHLDYIKTNYNLVSNPTQFKTNYVKVTGQALAIKYYFLVVVIILANKSITIDSFTLLLVSVMISSLNNYRKPLKIVQEAYLF